jgi:hypothetical protein
MVHSPSSIHLQLSTHESRLPTLQQGNASAPLASSFLPSSTSPWVSRAEVEFLNRLRPPPPSVQDHQRRASAQATSFLHASAVPSLSHAEVDLLCRRPPPPFSAQNQHDQQQNAYGQASFSTEIHGVDSEYDRPPRGGQASHKHQLRMLDLHYRENDSSKPQASSAAMLPHAAIDVPNHQPSPGVQESIQADFSETPSLLQKLL